jgi:hypothetical protein
MIGLGGGTGFAKGEIGVESVIELSCDGGGNTFNAAKTQDNNERNDIYIWRKSADRGLGRIVGVLEVKIMIAVTIIFICQRLGLMRFWK